MEKSLWVQLWLSGLKRAGRGIGSLLLQLQRASGRAVGPCATMGMRDFESSWDFSDSPKLSWQGWKGGVLCKVPGAPHFCKHFPPRDGVSAQQARQSFALRLPGCLLGNSPVPGFFIPACVMDSSRSWLCLCEFSGKSHNYTSDAQR